MKRLSDIIRMNVTYIASFYETVGRIRGTYFDVLCLTMVKHPEFKAVDLIDQGYPFLFHHLPTTSSALMPLCHFLFTLYLLSSISKNPDTHTPPPDT
jgi:hypothetical protein